MRDMMMGLGSMSPETMPKPNEDQGINSLAPLPKMNEKELINEMIKVLQGQSTQDPQAIIKMFVQSFGQEALEKLVAAVQSGEIGGQSAGKGLLKGAGDGMDDLIPAKIDNEEDILVSQDEYLVPADVVAQLGNGSSDAGGEVLDGVVDEVRKAKYGRAVQPPKMDPKEFFSNIV